MLVETTLTPCPECTEATNCGLRQLKAAWEAAKALKSDPDLPSGAEKQSEMNLGVKGIRKTFVCSQPLDYPPGKLVVIVRS